MTEDLTATSNIEVDRALSFGSQLEQVRIREDSRNLESTDNSVSLHAKHCDGNLYYLVHAKRRMHGYGKIYMNGVNRVRCALESGTDKPCTPLLGFQECASSILRHP